MNIVTVLLALLIAVSVYLLMSTQLNRWLYGLILFSSLINVNILLLGRVYFSLPAFISKDGGGNLGNPLPQAMVLTAIVISFALIAFSLIVLRELYRKSHTLRDMPLSMFKTRKKRRHDG